jgi:hypothetical protein
MGMNSALRVGVSSSIALVLVVVGGGALVEVTACSSGDVAVGATPTCTWNEAASRDAGLAVVSGPPGGYKVGAVLESVDLCNGCGCTAQGFECTNNVCPPPSRTFDDSTCPPDTSTCPDGTVLRRTTPACVFAFCPQYGGQCTARAKLCDGGAAAKSGPFCTQPCP